MNNAYLNDVSIKDSSGLILPSQLIQIILLLSHISKQNKSIRLYSSTGALNESLVDGRSLQEFLKSKAVPRDESIIFLTLLLNNPFSESIEPKELIDVYCRDRSSQNLKACYILKDGFLISSEDWAYPQVEIRVHEYIESGDISDSIEYIINCWDIQSYNDLTIRFRENINFENLDFDEVIEYLSNNYPKLILIESARDNLKDLFNDTDTPSILRHLKAIGEYSLTYPESLGGLTAINSSPESPSTLSKYGNERKFGIPSDTSLVYSYHSKTGDKRIYIHLDKSTQTIYVGYIGKHLRTVSDPN